MDLTKEDITKSLGVDLELIEYLPYLLQDLWDMGTNPDTVLALINKYSILNSINAKVLDLGCGKGAVSIKIAQKFGVKVVGLDAMEAFIEEAENYAEKHLVGNMCKFYVKDIKEAVKTEREYGLVVFGAVGQLFGTYEKTLSSLSQCIKKGGYLIIDDGYMDDDSDYKDDNYIKHGVLLKIIKESGFTLVEEKIEHDISVINNRYFEFIKKRADELRIKYPEKTRFFENYVKSQEIENKILENKIKCVVLVLKKI
ncbi:MAG: bifunctional 3-demethylubiquinone-9 3-methyltransferase/ 2-octaprenyl-6-hydroxy phenol methylase [Candidatus Methanofastidiosum methylothiophilum]|uniref:Bifunctional 3-demethylubiquinone-9 3-methyltransferase/ 2-octaprenyl-6-hydroxy phenol methylase n=1 Tax=Candidatus Methanofastidiosum methylothiophilum TaxID=1705564 RepID=A0A150IK47_9EURY|nr:MAG: bifunctional 3-demethylubiquinone-9 3-methyltransferase/ 2-octaprenyl-6-hydroxy phenol methylase [Candidatus Methanofastidiosum methylthiophilus]KYC47033.1 MAG: bifunctional 3-demethylubiquinone-9 3-methyltransferase/ 2-octaprenyl-6-hydroxy phenol methylase [Candidatus Methanofastidiosum methylthiophilus]KYC49462.1 MAG: bifunctional 3-demethylubiquinone-9 3-methyltransferase/ 2-octaprenyl-6-hydroxy phenol methylase [Candidatus Methanofastidiosum methylthiophilus]